LHLLFWGKNIKYMSLNRYNFDDMPTKDLNLSLIKIETDFFLNNPPIIKILTRFIPHRP